MDRRHFLWSSIAVAGALTAPHLVVARPADPTPGLRRSGTTRPRALLLIDLVGGNDGLNTVVPYADPLYRHLRPTLALPMTAILPLLGTPTQAPRRDGARRGLHPALAPLMPLWAQGEMAIVEGVGTGAGDISHYRAAQLWQTASAPTTYRDDAWIDRVPLNGAIGTGERLGWLMPPLEEDASIWLEPAQANRRRQRHRFQQQVDGAINAIITAGSRPADAAPLILRLSLSGFDTHHRQAARHAALLATLAEGIATMQQRLLASGDWSQVLVMTTSEFGRSLAENVDRGTEHGDASVMLLLGGAIRGGLYGHMPKLQATQGLSPTVDFRAVHAAVLERWLGVSALAVLGEPSVPRWPDAELLPMRRV